MSYSNRNNVMALDKPNELKARLYLPLGDQGGGFVILGKEADDVVAEYSPGQVEILLALNGAIAADIDLAAPARGWRSPAAIIANLRYPLEEASLRRSISRINQVFRKAVTKQTPGLVVPPLLTCKRKI